MRLLLAGIAALLLALLIAPAFADDNKDKDKKDPAPDTKKDVDNKDKDAPDAKKDADKKDAPTNTEKTIKAGQVTGKVVEVNGTGKALKLEVTYEVSSPNVGELQAMEQAKINLARAIASRDANGAANAQRDLAYHAARTTNVEQKTKQVDINAEDDVKIRFTDPPAAYDEKGNLKKRTAKELKELKGSDPNLPGYPAEFSDIHQGGYVKVSLVKKKDAPHHTSGAKSKDKDADPDPLGDNLPQASIIEILPEPATPGK